MTPIPGVIMIGAFAKSPMIKQPNAEEKIVANTLKVAGIWASTKINGFTMMIYEIAKSPLARK